MIRYYWLTLAFSSLRKMCSYKCDVSLRSENEKKTTTLNDPLVRHFIQRLFQWTQKKCSFILNWYCLIFPKNTLLFTASSSLYVCVWSYSYDLISPTIGWTLEKVQAPCTLITSSHSLILLQKKLYVSIIRFVITVQY